jgi:hypothetical protein
MLKSGKAAAEKRLLGQKLRQSVQKVTPVDKGGLKGSINYNITQSGVRVGAGAKYAIFVEKGTRSHWVEPKFASALIWVDAVSGTTFGSKGHKVSGIKKREYLLKGCILVLGKNNVKKVG